jgi:hypothetical protein
MHNIPLNGDHNESFTGLFREVPLHDKEFWDFCIFLIVYDLGISNQIRVGILNLMRMLIPIGRNSEPEGAIIQWSQIEPFINKIIQTKKQKIIYVDDRNTHNRLIIATFASNI